MKAFLLVVTAALLLVSCSNNKEEIKKIEALEKEVAGASSSDPKKAKELITAYEKFANEHPKDSLAPEYLFKAGNVNVALGKFEVAIKQFDKIYTTYPDNKRAPESLFFQADIYRANMMDAEMANKKFSEFLKKYPNHGFADDAKILMQNSDKSDEELLQEILKKNQAQNDSLEVKQ